MQKLLLTIAAMVTLAACQTNDPLAPQPSTEQPGGNAPAQTTEAGKPIGAPVIQTIGPSGGSLSVPVSATANETVVISFPAGSLPSATAIKVQLLENKAPGGIGPAIDVSPKDIKLSKPTTIVWQYEGTGLNGTGSAALGMAYQRQDGSWVGRSNLTADEAQQTLTAVRPAFDLKYPLAFYQNFYLKYGSNTLLPNERLELIVAYQPNHSDRDENTDREVLLAALLPWKPVGSENLKNWRLNGSNPVGANKAWGSLSVHNNGEKALYIAPDRVPSVNPAAISVDLKTGGRSRIILVANLQIIAPNRLIAAGKSYENAKVSAAMGESGNLFVSLEETEPKEAAHPASAFFQIKNFNGLGTYTIDPTWVGPKVVIGGKEGGKTGLSYEYGYNKDAQVHFSNGSITITEYTGRTGKIKGSFSATLYHHDKAKNTVRSSSFSVTFQTTLH